MSDEETTASKPQTRYEAAESAIITYTAIIDRLTAISDKAFAMNSFEPAAMSLGNAMQAAAMRTQLTTALADEREHEAQEDPRPPAREPRDNDDPLAFTDED